VTAAPSDDGLATARPAPRPRESLPRRVRRVYRSRGAIPPLRYWLIFGAVPSAVVFLLLFLVNAGWNGWGRAYDVMLAITSPWDRGAVRFPWLAFPLSFAGWLIMPALVSIVIGYAVDRGLSRQGRATVDEVRALLGDRREVTEAEPDHPAAP
jgi:hypothetical protein